MIDRRAHDHHDSQPQCDRADMLGGLDRLVFTAGAGENHAFVRELPKSNTVPTEPRSKTMYARILVPLDRSETAHHALDHAAVLARLSGGTIVLLHVIEELEHVSGFEPPKVYIEEVRPGFLTAGQALLDRAAKRLRQDGIAVETVLLEGGGERASTRIVEQVEAARCDLVVLGTHGRRGIGRVLLGSDAEQVARLAPVPVMLVRTAHAAQARPESAGSR